MRESLTQKMLIYTVTKQLKPLSVSHSIIDSWDLLKKMLIHPKHEKLLNHWFKKWLKIRIHPVMKLVKIFVSQWIIHASKVISFKWGFVQYWNRGSLYEWVSESFIQETHPEDLIHSVVKQVLLLLSHWTFVNLKPFSIN